jgi:hypothetical protein
VIVTTIKIPIWLWAAVILDLRQRGAGVRESGAFLLGRDDRDPARVTSYICYDDVDPERISRAPSPSTPPAAPRCGGIARRCSWICCSTCTHRRRREAKLDRRAASDDAGDRPHGHDCSELRADAVVVAGCGRRLRIHRRIQMAHPSAVGARSPRQALPVVRP